MTQSLGGGFADESCCESGWVLRPMTSLSNGFLCGEDSGLIGSPPSVTCDPSGEQRESDRVFESVIVKEVAGLPGHQP